MISMPFSPYATEPADLAVCRCTQAVQPHEHGTRGMYNYHRCRCTPCREANLEYSRQSTKHRPRREMVDAGLVRSRITELRAAGLTVLQISNLSGIHAKVIEFAMKGRNGKKPKTVKASTFRALNAISYKDAEGAEKRRGRIVNGDIPRRQLQSLHSLGWCGSEIATRIGANASTISHLLAGNGITEDYRARIDRLYAELHGTNAPQETANERRSATVARNRALANGWTSDTATDHEHARPVRAH
ncbi:hypothetical protein J1902_16055 [Arthrobacter sp. PO-11]|uniref:Uncharacterized protein n=2 Tax=Arthrobacter cavernae TaxID=2817681 RepID=A0A939KNM9_9MICC|nr:hypothetical protein [Arthrobacter cavernae]